MYVNKNCIYKPISFMLLKFIKVKKKHIYFIDKLKIKKRKHFF